MHGNVIVIELNNNIKHQPLLEGKPATCGMRSGMVRLEAGQSCSEHSTNSYEEMLVFLSGEGQLIINKKTSYEVGVGKISYIPPETIHYVKNTGREQLVYTYCVAAACKD